MKKFLIVLLCVVSANAFAISGDWSNVKTRTFTIDHAPRFSDASLVVRKEWGGARPKLQKVVNNTYYIKFVWRDELQRVKVKFIITKKNK